MRRILTLVCCVFAFSYSGLAQFQFGAQAGLTTGSGGLFGVGAKGHYTINEQFAGQASFTYYFETGTVWALDLDVHYSGFEIGDVESFSLTPFAGLNILTFSSGLGFGSFSSTNVNIGMNGRLPLSGNLEFFVEPKLVLGGGSGFVVAAGVYF